MAVGRRVCALMSVKSLRKVIRHPCLVMRTIYYI